MTSSNKLLRELLFWICKRNNSSLIGQCAGHVTRFLKSFAFTTFWLLKVVWLWCFMFRRNQKVVTENFIIEPTGDKYFTHNFSRKWELEISFKLGLYVFWMKKENCLCKLYWYVYNGTIILCKTLIRLSTYMLTRMQTLLCLDVFSIIV